MKYYDLGNIKASIERTSSGYFEVYVKEKDKDCIFYSVHSTEAEALREILSYCEIEAEA